MIDYNPPELGKPCPAKTCGAKIGEPCRRSGGEVRDEPHGLRWLALFVGPFDRCPHGPGDCCKWTGLWPVFVGGEDQLEELLRIGTEQAIDQLAGVFGTEWQLAASKGEPPAAPGSAGVRLVTKPAGYIEDLVRDRAALERVKALIASGPSGHTINTALVQRAIDGTVPS